MAKTNVSRKNAARGSAEKARPIEKRAYRIREFTEAFGIPKSSIYFLVNKGELQLTKVGKRTVILREHAEAWLSRCEAATRGHKG
jgi:hypothetical protein